MGNCMHKSSETKSSNIKTKTVLEKMGIDTGNYNVKKLFSGNNVKKNGECLKRIKCILLIYSSWLKIKNEERKDDNDIIDIYDLINGMISIHYTFNSFLKDYNYLI
eukprot:146155_1